MTVKKLISMQSDIMNFKFGNLHYSNAISGKNTTLLLLHAFHSSTTSYEPLCDLLKAVQLGLPRFSWTWFIKLR
ncbi:hypothetical protein [Caedibacter taeniospiralis]|uniref:hypothetical protein n=1 Tax=Caedibacter taeniospiralis TaxID=28907 RepID=UPI000C26F9A8|nr:hypothetical protein [Caedibacter taeniospiralis]